MDFSEKNDQKFLSKCWMLDFWSEPFQRMHFPFLSLSPLAFSCNWASSNIYLSHQPHFKAICKNVSHWQPFQIIIPIVYFLLSTLNRKLFSSWSKQWQNDLVIGQDLLDCLNANNMIIGYKLKARTKTDLTSLVHHRTI